MSRGQAQEDPMVGQRSITEQTGEQRQGLVRQQGILKRFLLLEAFHGAAARLAVVVQRRINNFGKKLSDRSQASSRSAVDRIQRLAQDELPARLTVARVQPVMNRAVP